MKGKVIVIIQNSLRTTMIFRFSYISELINEGYNVTIIAPVDCVRSKLEFNKIGVRIISVNKPTSLITTIKYITKLNLCVIYFRCIGAVFIVHFLVSIIPVIFTLLPFNNKCILSIEGLGSFFSKNVYAVKMLRYIFKVNKCRELFCNSDEFKLLGNHKSIITGGIGVDLSKFNINKIINNVRNDYVILYVGRLISDKGIHDAIKVLRELLKRNYCVRLVIVGDIYPNNPSSLSHDDIYRYKCEFGEDIEFKGFCSNPEYYYNSSDVLILPSIREGFPVCVMEANACGIPVVAYDVPGCRDAIINNVNGVLVRFGDIGGLSESVEGLLNESVIKRYSITSRIYAENNFDVNLKTKNFIEEIKKLID